MFELHKPKGLNEVSQLSGHGYRLSAKSPEVSGAQIAYKLICLWELEQGIQLLCAWFTTKKNVNLYYFKLLSLWQFCDFNRILNSHIF